MSSIPAPALTIGLLAAANDFTTVESYGHLNDSSAPLPVVFAIFSAIWLREFLSWNHLVGFALIATGAAFVSKPWA